MRTDCSCGMIFGIVGMVGDNVSIWMRFRDETVCLPVKDEVLTI